MAYFLTLWRKVLNAGMYGNMPFNDLKKLRIINGLAVINILFNLLISLWSYFLHTPFLALFNYFIALVMVVVIMLNSYHRFKLARMLLFLFLTVHVQAVSIFFAFGAEYYLFPLLILAGFVVGKKWVLFSYFSFIIIFFILVKSQVFIPLIIPVNPELTKYITIFDGVLALNFNLILIILFLRQYDESREYNLLKNALLQKITANAVEKADYTTLLLKEMNHRVKNNLQLISSLLSLNARHLKNKEAKKAVNDAKNRIYSIALIHRQLYKEDYLTAINISDYLNDLIPFIKDTLAGDEQGLTIKTDTDQFILSLEDAVSVGLILNELVTNSVKYGIKKNKGLISVRVKLNKPNGVLLTVEDNGKKIKTIMNKKNYHFGLKLVETLVSNYNGKINVDEKTNRITIELILETDSFAIEKDNGNE